MTGQNDRPDESLTGQAHDQDIVRWPAVILSPAFARHAFLAFVGEEHVTKPTNEERLRGKLQPL